MGEQILRSGGQERPYCLVHHPVPRQNYPRHPNHTHLNKINVMKLNIILRVYIDICIYPYSYSAAKNTDSSLDLKQNLACIKDLISTLIDIVQFVSNVSAAKLPADEMITALRLI